MNALFSKTITAALFAATCFVFTTEEAMAQSAAPKQIEPAQTNTITNTMKAGEPLPILGAGLVLGMGMLLKERQ